MKRVKREGALNFAKRRLMRRHKEEQWNRLRGTVLQKRRLGRTNLQVSIVGFGGTWISELSTPEAVKVVSRAFDLGINYFDTAKLDGDSEEKIGEALQNVQ